MDLDVNDEKGLVSKRRYEFQQGQRQVGSLVYLALFAWSRYSGVAQTELILVIDSSLT